MIVICEECGKKYRVEPSKIKGKAASFKCRGCTHVITVTKPETESSAPTPSAAQSSAPSSETVENKYPSPRTELEPKASAADKILTKPLRKTGRVGVRAKMILLFLFVPFILMVGASLLYFLQLWRMSSLLTHESTNIVNQMAEEEIIDLSTAVAIQCRLYILAHPELKKQDFMKDMGFKTLAVQPGGLKGYTALYEMPDSEGIWRTWAHVNPKIIGINMHDLKKPLGRNFPGFWKIFSGVKGGKRSQGYYTWQDKDGTFRDKFMVCTPVAGTPYVVAATTYIDEFHEPIRQMESQAKLLTEKTERYTFVILGVTLVLIGIIVSVYGHRLTGKIRSLTEVTERISVGDLGAEVETQSRDEIGELAEAISRMQESIRLSIERLRRRR
ncbi:MAG: zinc-ribbon domain-containing protein [Desulfobacterales bacterium]|nr:MAG: zinc-ribbon domain-containing protein [Desulfobacterales bacterium]